MTGRLRDAFEQQLIIPWPEAPRPLKLAEPTDELAVRPPVVDRGAEGVQAEAEGGAGGDDSIEVAIQPFLDEARGGDGRLAVVFAGGEREGDAQ